jgi:hypothetical protein
MQSMSAPPSTDSPCTLGVLLVHGIGEQPQGDTLSRFAEPLIDWLRQTLGGNTASTAACLRPPLIVGDTPAHARMTFAPSSRCPGPNARSVAEEWLFAEAWWAPQVAPPALSDFMAWLLRCAPWMLMFHLNQRWLSAPTLWRPFKVLRGALITLLWVVVSLFANLGLLLVCALALIPVGPVRRFFSNLLTHLSGIVGDAYVKIRSPLQRRAQEDSVLVAARWLRTRCARIVVVAHSQGASIAHGALGRGDSCRVERFVTVGSGMTKLSALRFFDQQGALDRLAPALAAPLLIAAAVVAVRARQIGLNDASGALWAPLLFASTGAGFLASTWITARAALANLRKTELRSELEIAQPGLPWCDIVASHDPVPQGNVTQYFAPPLQHGIQARRVTVLRSLWKDHTQYWNAHATFLPVLAMQLLRCRGSAWPAAPMRGVLRGAERKLKFDLRVLGALHALDGLALAAPLLYGWQRLLDSVARWREVLKGEEGIGKDAPLAFVDSALTSAETAVRWTVGVTTATSAPWSGDAVNGAVALTLLVLALWLWQRLTFGLWQGWSANRNKISTPPATSAASATAAGPGDAWLAWTGRAIFHTLFVLFAALPLIASAIWTFIPGGLTEALTYHLLGALLLSVFVVFLMASTLTTVVKQIAGLWPRGEQFTADTARQAINKAGGVGLTLCMPLFLLTGNDVLPQARDFLPLLLGFGGLIWGLARGLLHLWVRLGEVTEHGAWRAGVLAIPPVAGLLAATVLPELHRPNAVLGAATIFSCLALGVLLLVLTLVRRAR